MHPPGTHIRLEFRVIVHSKNERDNGKNKSQEGDDIGRYPGGSEVHHALRQGRQHVSIDGRSVTATVLKLGNLLLLMRGENLRHGELQGVSAEEGVWDNKVITHSLSHSLTHSLNCPSE